MLNAKQWRATGMISKFFCRISCCTLSAIKRLMYLAITTTKQQPPLLINAPFLFPYLTWPCRNPRLCKFSNGLMLLNPETVGKGHEISTRAQAKTFSINCRCRQSTPQHHRQSYTVLGISERSYCCKMKTFLLVCCIVASAYAADNIVQLATKLGANTLVKLVSEAGLANTLATGGRSIHNVFTF